MKKGIEVKNISKSFGKNQALSDVSIVLEEGKIYGLLGRNGAGKSTLLNILNNRLFADKGEVYIDGEAAKENDGAQGKVYLMSEKTLYPEGMKIKEVFHWSKAFYPNFDSDYAERLSEKFGLNLRRKVKALSTGYASIFKCIIALSVNTPYVFFDEPVLGLDANHRELFYKTLIEKYAENPFTAIISTHLIEEVSNVIEEVVLIKNGRIIKSESRDTLVSSGYTISGKTDEVDEYCTGRAVIGEDRMGGFKTVYIMGDIKNECLPDTLEKGSMDLQKLFVHMTNEQEEKP